MPEQTLRQWRRGRKRLTTSSHWCNLVFVRSKTPHGDKIKIKGARHTNSHEGDIRRVDRTYTPRKGGIEDEKM